MKRTSYLNEFSDVVDFEEKKRRGCAVKVLSGQSSSSSYLKRMPNKPAAPIAGMALRWIIEHHCPGVGEPGR